MQSKKIITMLSIALIVTIVAALSGCASPSASPSPAASAGGDLKAGLPASLDFTMQVTGGSTPVTLPYADLKNMEFTELKGVSTVNSVGTVTAGDYVGIPLMDIVNKAGLPSGDVSFKVTASDGYVISYTKEQFNVGILALKTNGTANVANINDPNAIALVIPGELKNMWLKMPTKIEIVASAVKPVALSISGANVTTRPGFTLDELKNMTQKTITTTDSKGNTITATGVPLNTLLDRAGPKGTVVQFISGDASGYSKNVSLTDIYNSPDAIVAIDENDVLRDIIPGQPSNTWVGNLTRIRID